MSVSMQRILTVLTDHSGSTVETVASYVSEPARKVAPVLGRMRTRRLVTCDKGRWYPAQLSVFEQQETAA